MNKKRMLPLGLKVFSFVGLILISHLFLQMCQNQMSFELAYKFAFLWHTEKFLLSSLVLVFVLVFFTTLSGSFLVGGVTYSIMIVFLGVATYMKMRYRQEPLYPDDLKMIAQIRLFYDLLGPIVIFIAGGLILLVIGLWIWQWKKSLKETKQERRVRWIVFLVSVGGLVYASHFNDEENLLRLGFDRTALWVPYSQKMNYYNIGFVGGFLYNLKREAMEEPADYSKERILEITEKYKTNAETEVETPNIIFVMSESFSNPQNLTGVTLRPDPLEQYLSFSEKTYSGKMLSQNYGGGTANIEFEALTSFAMEALTPQMTTPYTMLVPKMTKLPSVVSLLKARGYKTTAIHPYDTSMYKRRDVYEILGFDQFISEEAMTHQDKIENNPFISDEAAYQEVLDQLKTSKPQFVHLVTMQTHVPYNTKYEKLDYTATGVETSSSLQNYAQDIAYSTQALLQFLEELKNLPQRTLVVFWGDHLPGIYSDQVQSMNEVTTLRETEFLMWDSKQTLTHKENTILSPFYFASELFKLSKLPSTGFYTLLEQLKAYVPAFEKGFYRYEDSWQDTFFENEQARELYKEYTLIQYDILQGKQYSLATDFFGS